VVVLEVEEERKYRVSQRLVCDGSFTNKPSASDDNRVFSRLDRMPLFGEAEVV